MALTLTTDDLTGHNYTVNARAADNFKIVTGSWSIPSTYADGGITANLATLGFGSGQILFAQFVCTEGPAIYDYANDKVKLLTTSATSVDAYTETASDVNVGTPGGYFVVFGYGPA